MSKKECYEDMLPMSPVFQGISKDRLPGLLKELGGYVKSYKKNEVVRHAGEELASLGLVLSGEVQASMANLEKDQIIERFLSGDTFGEAAVFADQVSPVEIKALVPSVLVFLPAQEILNGYKNPDIARLGMNLLQETAKKTLKLSGKIRILKEKRLRVRLMIYLRSLTPDKNGSLTIPYNRTDLAQYLGANRSALSRELALMCEEGLLQVEKQKVKILNPIIWNRMKEEME